MPRIPPSAADAAEHLRNARRGSGTLGGGGAESPAIESDVLHAIRLPDFGGRLPAADAERLLTYLTAPYVRIPLTLRLFTQPNTITALVSTSLQSLVDAALFETGDWRPPSLDGVPPTHAPSSDRSCPHPHPHPHPHPGVPPTHAPSSDRSCL